MDDESLPLGFTMVDIVRNSTGISCLLPQTRPGPSGTDGMSHEAEIGAWFRREPASRKPGRVSRILLPLLIGPISSTNSQGPNCKPSKPSPRHALDPDDRHLFEYMYVHRR